MITSFTNDMPYISTLYSANISSLTDHKGQLSHRVLKFKWILETASCLHCLLPNQRDPSVTCRLRTANKFPHLPNRTKNIRPSRHMHYKTINQREHSINGFITLTSPILTHILYCIVL